jgi:outer membrane protein assembly factor BamA
MDMQSVIVLCEDNVYHDEIQKQFAQPFCLSSLEMTSDIYFDEQEFLYLINLKLGACIDSSDILNAVESIHKKSKFSSITIKKITDKDGIHLHFTFVAGWTFRKVKIHGPFHRKSFFSQAYIMNNGDRFDLSKHNHSLLKIKELLAQNGYHNNSVVARFDYDNKTKEIVVHLDIKKGKRFIIEAITVELAEESQKEDYRALIHQIKRKLSTALLSHYYKLSDVTREAIALKKYLGRRGFLHADIGLEERRKHGSSSIFMVWKIHLYCKRTFEFFGNRFFSTKELLEKILEFGKSAWLLPASLLAEELAAEYKRLGFWDVDIVAQEEKEKSFFVIQEGERVSVKDVQIFNAVDVGSSLIKKQCFSKLLHSSYYDDSLFEEALRKVSRLYVQRGYLSCVVVSHTFVKTDKPNEYILVITLDEGKRSHISSVVVEGYPDIVLDGPFKKDFFQDQSIFNMNIVDEQRSWLMNYFQKKGYVCPRIKQRIEMDNDATVLVWDVDPGKQVQFGKTIFVGANNTLPFYSAMSLLGYKEGDLWDQEKIKKTFRAFKELDIFESITLTPDYADNNNQKAVIIKLQPDDPYEVRVRAGLELQHVRKYQTFNGLTYKIGGTALMRNPFYSGDIARIDMDFARSHREIVAQYRRPFFLSTPIMGMFQVYSMSYDQPGFVGSVNDIYTLTQNGFSYGIERKTTLCTFGVTAGCEGMATKIKDPQMQESLVRAINFQPQLVDQMVPFFVIEPTVMIEYVDNGLNPTSGFLGLCSLKGMVPFQKKYKDTLFFKLLCEQSFFVPIGSLVGAFRFRFGHIFYRELSAIMPSERFYLGGSHSIRGYEADLAPPLGVFVDEELDEHIVPRGGKSMGNVNMELRFPIFKKMGGVFFHDMGVLSSDMFADFKPHNIIAATGFGGRFYTPLGPLRFDIGWKWRKIKTVERSYAWFLTFGQAF